MLRRLPDWAKSALSSDRSRGAAHPRIPEAIYLLDYSYLHDTVGGDGDGVPCSQAQSAALPNTTILLASALELPSALMLDPVLFDSPAMRAALARRDITAVYRLLSEALASISAPSRSWSVRARARSARSSRAARSKLTTCLFASAPGSTSLADGWDWPTMRTSRTSLRRWTRT